MDYLKQIQTQNFLVYITALFFPSKYSLSLLHRGYNKPDLSGKYKLLLFDHCWEKSKCVLNPDSICTKTLISAHGILQTGNAGPVYGFVVYFKVIVFIIEEAKDLIRTPLCYHVWSNDGSMYTTCEHYKLIFR